MPRRSGSRRYRLPVLALALLFAVGLAADTVVHVAAGRGTQMGGAASEKRSIGRTTGDSTIDLSPRSSVAEESSRLRESSRAARVAAWQRDLRSTGTAGADRWSFAIVGITLVLAICGAVAAVARRGATRASSRAVTVVSRTHLSPKHSVYLLRVGRRSLLVGTGPQGAPALIAELDEFADIAPETTPGEIL
jgi:hypothetical protein